MARRSSSDAAFAGIAERYDLPPHAVEQLRELHRLLVDDPLAPTAVRDPLKVIDDHLADSLVALELEPIRSARTLADLGSGAGVPGLPLAIALPELSVALVESAARKCAFLERAIARCAVTNARAVHARAESWPEGIESSDVVTARALGPLEVVVEYAAPLLALGGTLVVWRGQRDPEAESAAARAAAELGLEPVKIVPAKPYPAARSRHLYLMSKVTSTPSGFPRRPGVAAKRPLGSQRPLP
ncbi:MAG TPA: 16S rRNA (guanine(527)-N(7))-methyltransferase RsmG [Solirubrobacteraceae bacterium]|nr:16S rRNA (guanine(527)-N(7))-methyltransferase RsmG [Solirubrobacteraceae bacterium]